MSTTFKDISAAFDVELNSVVSIPVIEWENFTDDGRTLGDEYISQFWLGGTTEAGSLGDIGLDQINGVYQINVNVKAGNGKARINELCDLIADAFRPRKKLTYNGVSVRIKSLSRNAITVDGAYATAVLDIEYETFTAQRA